MKSRAVGLAVGIVAKGKAGSASFFLGECVSRDTGKKGKFTRVLGAPAAFLGELVSRIDTERTPSLEDILKRARTEGPADFA